MLPFSMGRQIKGLQASSDGYVMMRTADYSLPVLVKTSGLFFFLFDRDLVVAELSSCAICSRRSRVSQVL